VKRNKFSIRLSVELTAEVSRQAAKRGITRTAWAAHLIERGLLAETSERFLEAVENRADRPAASSPPAGGASTVPAVPPGWEKVVFMGCFTAAMMKQLNASLSHSTAEIGKIAAAAREQATAETQAILKR
jgi:hypothetical protein